MYVSRDKTNFELIKAEEIVGQNIYYKKNVKNTNIGIKERQYQDCMMCLLDNVLEDMVFPDYIYNEFTNKSSFNTKFK
jgi:hypothetical protein